MDIETKTPQPMDNIRANAKIKVIGVGGGGGNAVTSRYQKGNPEVEYWVRNTDVQALSRSSCPNKLILGRNVTAGKGAGGNPDFGKKAAEDSYDEIKNVLTGSDRIFISAGEGGGTGTGGAPVIAKAAKECGALVLAIVTRPFTFEGPRRKKVALEGIETLKKAVDALIIVSNDKLRFNNGKMPIAAAFKAADKILGDAVKTVTDRILLPGVINLDFNDVKSTLWGKGVALIGMGEGKGNDRALLAAKNAFSSPLLESSIKGAHNRLVNFTRSEDVTLDEINSAMECILEAANAKDEDSVSSIFGAQIDPDLKDTRTVSIIATSFDKDFDFSDDSLPRQRHSIATPVIKEEKIETPKVEQEIKEQKEEKENILPDFLARFRKNQAVDAPIVEEVKPEEKIEEEKKEVIPIQDNDDDDSQVLSADKK